MTDITFIIDRSGSMSSMVNDVVGGYETFVKKQQTEVGAARFSLVQFDDEYKTVFTAVPIQNVSPSLNFYPRGSTALRDALGKTINAIGARLRALPKSERPTKVIVVVMTDGEENASREFTQVQIKSMVEHQTTQYNWDFLFLGANIDSFNTGMNYGFNPFLTANYSYTCGGVRAAMDTVSMYASSCRSGSAMSGSLSDTQAQNEAAQNATGTVVNSDVLTSPTGRRPLNGSPTGPDDVV